MKPLLQKVRETEEQLAASRTSLETVEKMLADQSIYTDPERAAELADLIKDQASHKSVIAVLEWEWMEASERLESAG